MPADPRADRAVHRVDPSDDRRGVGALVGDAHVDPVVLRIGRDRRGGGADELVEGLLDARLADAEELERAGAEGRALAEGRFDLDLPHPRHLARDTGHRDDPRRAAPDVPAGRRAERVRQGPRGWDEPGLLAVALGHRRAASGEPRSELGLERRIDRRRLLERPGDRFAGEVVLGRPEPAGADDEVAPLDRPADGRRRPAEVVPDGGHVEEIDAQARQPPGQVGGIRVHDLAQQQLGANGEQLSAHLGHLLLGTGTPLAKPAGD